MSDVDISEWVYDKILELVPRCKKSSKMLTMRCEFCGDSQKDKRKMRGHYYIGDDTSGSYHCFNCEKTCDGFALLEQLSGDSYSDIKDEYFKLKYSGNFKSNKAKTKSTNPLDKLQPITPLSSWTYDLPEKVINYLTKRQVFNAPFLPSDFRFMWCPVLKRLVIPWMYKNELVYYQYRTFKRSELKYIFPKDHFKSCFNLDNVDISFKYLFTVEGVFDSIFILNGICVGGRSLTKLQEELIKTRYPHHKIVRFFDNDKAGRESMIKSAKRYPRDLFLMYPTDILEDEDINDYAIRVGVDNVLTNPVELEKLITYGSLVEMKLTRMYK